jgi:hypothetical protein
VVASTTPVLSTPTSFSPLSATRAIPEGLLKSL